MRKILIVGAGIIDKPHAAGITVRSIIDGIDPNLIAGLVWGETGENMQQTKIKLVKLSFGILSPARIFDNSRLKKASHRIKKVETVSSLNSSEEKKHFVYVRRVIRDLRQWIALIPARSKVQIHQSEMEEIRSFSPDVIYTVGESVATLRLAYEVSMALNIPIIIHFMDNWRHSIEWASNPLLKGYQRQLSKYCDMCYSRSTECIAISDRMAEAYEKETGVKHCVIMNSVSTKDFYCPPREGDGTIRFVYAGGLHLGRDKALRTIGECIDQVGEEAGKDIDFTIYTSKDNMELFSGQFSHLKSTHLHIAIPHDQIQNVYQNSDVLVHVESSALYSNEFFKYSVSTKISEYLATGRPILFYGPNNIYLYSFLRNNRLAFTVENKEEVMNSLYDLVQKTDNVFSQNAREYAESHFDISVARQRFYKVLSSVCLPCGSSGK